MSKYFINTFESSDLPNKRGITDQDEINQLELIGFLKARDRAIDELDTTTVFTNEYLYQLHRDAFSELYEFAGKLRTVNLSKDNFSFAPALTLENSMQIFQQEYLDPINNTGWENENDLLIHLAKLHAELLFIHPFREGNGRIIRLFTDMIAIAKREKELNFDFINQGDNFEQYKTAVQQAAVSNFDPMIELFSRMEL
jgi:cell filamentation protein